MERWERARNVLREKLGESNFETWIGPLRVAAGANGKVFVSAPNKFFRDFVARNYLEDLRQSLHIADEPPLDLVLRVEERCLQGELFAAGDSALLPRSPTRRPLARVGGLVPHYTFKDFVVGPSNEFAHAAARAVASRPGEQYNPLFIYGSVGVGKTHLVNAIGHAVLQKHPMEKVAYLPSESFVNDMISSLRRDRMDDFKNRFRKVDLLIIDDVQFLAGRERTQEEFFHTFNSLYERHRQIILTSDKFPKDIPELEERLRNRFESGLTADIHTPEMETRAAILQKKAEAEGFCLSPEVAAFIATQIATNVRELEGALTRLAAMASLYSEQITVPFAKRVLEPHLGDRRKPPTVEDIQRVVCEQFGLSLHEIKSKRRTQNLARARQIAMYLSRKLVHASFPVIGEKFGGRDHSTVIHANTAISRRLEADAPLRLTLQEIERSLAKHCP